MRRRCKPVLDSDWLLRHVVVAPESPGSIRHLAVTRVKTIERIKVLYDMYKCILIIFREKRDLKLYKRIS